MVRVQADVRLIDVVTYRAFRTLQWAMERLPRGLSYALAIVVARFAFLFARAARRRLEANLRVALPEASPGEIRYIAWRNFRNHSKAYADLMRLPRARVETLRPLLRLQGVEHLEAARAKGKGVLVILNLVASSLRPFVPRHRRGRRAHMMRIPAHTSLSPETSATYIHLTIQ